MRVELRVQLLGVADLDVHAQADLGVELLAALEADGGLGGEREIWVLIRHSRVLRVWGKRSLISSSKKVFIRLDRFRKFCKNTTFQPEKA